MKLVVDTRKGLAGDILSAGLIGLGADPTTMTDAMRSAGELLGSQAIVTHHFDDGVHRISLDLADQPDHLGADEARAMLSESFRKSAVAGPWRGMGERALEALIQAEAHVHSRHPSLKAHFHGGPVLHEASDIIVDLTGMVVGMAALDITSVMYVAHVNVGGGTVTFSHGTLEVPTPATRSILDSHGIPWENSDAGMEMATPTGAAILAGCDAKRISEAPISGISAMAGGTRPLSPVPFFLLE